MSTENMRQKLVNKTTCTDIVRNQWGMNDSQLTRIRGAYRIQEARRTLKLLNI